MFGWRHIAKKIGTVGSSDGTANGGGNMIIARRHIRYQGAEDIEGGIVTQPFLNNHIGGNFVDPHMARAFNHYLNVLGPGPFSQMTQFNQFAELRSVRAVVNAARAQSVSQTDGDIKLAEDLQKLVVIFIKWFFVAGYFYSCNDQRAAL